MIPICEIAIRDELNAVEYTQCLFDDVLFWYKTAKTITTNVDVACYLDYKKFSLFGKDIKPN